MTVNKVLVNGKLHLVRVLERKRNTFLVEVNEKAVKVGLDNVVQGETAVIEIDNQPFETRVKRIQGSTLQVRIGGKLFEVQVQRKPKTLTEPTLQLEPLAPATRGPAVSLSIEKDAVIAPLAGRIAVLKVKVGERVERGDLVCVLEAMKMENEILAPKAGFVKEIRVSEGAIVNKRDVLAVIS